MNSAVAFRKDIGYFPDLQALGVTNAFTYNNTRWGNMRRLQQINWQKYTDLLQVAGITSDNLAMLGVENNDGIQILTHANWEVYQRFAKNDEQNKGKNFLVGLIDCDGIITDQPIPLVLAPADCAGIVLTTLDQKTGKRFLIFLHSGLMGMQLNIIRKALRLAHLDYTFQNEDLDAFIFPHITGQNYQHRKDTWKHHSFLDVSEWEPYFLDQGDMWGIDFSRKIFDELKEQGITKVQDSGLDTYVENKEGRLFSQTYNKQHNPDGVMLRFGVVVQLQVNSKS